MSDSSINVNSFDNLLICFDFAQIRTSIIEYPRTCCFQIRFGTLLVEPVTFFFSRHFIFSTDVKMSLIGINYFVVCDASLQRLN